MSRAPQGAHCLSESPGCRKPSRQPRRRACIGPVRRVPELQAWLSNHQPADALEQRHREHMQALANQGPRCLDRDHFEPGHFTASAFVLSPERDALLLILHAKLGMWLQPGGHIEPGDPSVLAAARREVSEEVGLAELELLSPSPFDLDVHDIPAGRDPAHQHHDVRFLFGASSLGLTPASDALDARWVPLAEVAEQHSDESVMRAVRRLRALR